MALRMVVQVACGSAAARAKCASFSAVDDRRRIGGAEQDHADDDRQKATAHYVIPTSLLSPSMKR